MSDLTEIKTDIKWIKQMLSNHLEHHRRCEIALVVGVLLMIAERLFL